MTAGLQAQGLDPAAVQQDAALQSAVLAAKEGAIPRLKLLVLDVLCGTKDGADRCVLRSVCMVCSAGSCSSARLTLASVLNCFDTAA